MSFRSSPRQAGRRAGGVTRALVVVLALGLALAAAGTGLFSLPQAVSSGGPTVDTLDMIAAVSIESILGAETIQFSGSTTIERSAPRVDGGVVVTDLEVTSLDLTGTSVTGPVVLRQSPTLVTVGEFRGLQPSPDQFPASSFIDLFFEVDVPASPLDPLTLHNAEALHLVPTAGLSEVPLTAWPPVGVTFRADPDPCKPKLPVLPAEVCVTSASFFVGGSTTATPTPTSTLTPTPMGTPTATPVPVGGFAELPAMAGTPLAASSSSGPSTGLLVASAVTGVAVALGGASWYARRRRLPR